MFRRAGLQVLRNSLKAARASNITVTGPSVSGRSADLPRGFASLLKQLASNVELSLNPGLSVGAVRQFAKAAKANGNKELEKALTKEIKDQEKQYEPFAEEPPHGYKVVETPGSKELRLRKSHGTEEVELLTYIHPEEDYANDSAYAMDEAYDEERQEGEENTSSKAPIHFLVTVTKGGDDRSLVFDCSYDGDDFDIEMVQLEDSKIPESEAYGGPNFIELDEDLNGSFKKYLMDRGVDHSLVEALVGLRDDKEEREYGRWLKEVKSFITK